MLPVSNPRQTRKLPRTTTKSKSKYMDEKMRYGNDAWNEHTSNTVHNKHNSNTIIFRHLIHTLFNTQNKNTVESLIGFTNNFNTHAALDFINDITFPLDLKHEKLGHRTTRRTLPKLIKSQLTMEKVTDTLQWNYHRSHWEYCQVKKVHPYTL